MRSRFRGSGSSPRSSDLVQADRPMLLERGAGGEREAERLHAIDDRADVLGLAAREAQEVRELGAVRLAEADEERRVGGGLERRRVLLDGAERRAMVAADPA